MAAIAPSTWSRPEPTALHGVPSQSVSHEIVDAWSKSKNGIDPVAGHVPGAVNVPTADNLGEGGFRSLDEMRATYDRTGALQPDAEVAAYCGSGVTAAHDVLALRRLGVVAALYAGSWSEWVQDSSRPVATGP